VKLIIAGFPVIAKLQVGNCPGIIRPVLIIVPNRKFRFRNLKSEQMPGFYKAQKLWNCQTGLKTILPGIKNTVVYLLPLTSHSQLHIKHLRTTKNVTVLVIQVASHSKVARGICTFNINRKILPGKWRKLHLTIQKRY